jgi:hypothetical protein
LLRFDSVTQRAADEAMTRGDQNHDGGAPSMIIARIERMAVHFRDQARPDLDNASLTELFAFCFAMEQSP